mmetsp:Transcript_43275/g.79178  ORF Transcript_43275/g.79178 Transcript_43275/m.79178 type:complete len:797 (+) Transcript_43275:165-2555(+)
MALRGDDEIDDLLAMMGSGPTTTSTSMKPPTSSSKDKTKKRKKKGRDKTKERRKKPKCKNDERNSFADTRLSQNCFKWPCSKNNQRWLFLGPGLLHNCERYVAGSEEENGCYGSSACQSCGKSAANHELCLSSSWEEGLHDSVAACYPPCIISIAKIIVASRNARCLIGEYYATSKNNRREGEMPHMKMHELSKNVLLPPLNSTQTFSDMISNDLDSFVGSILGSLRRMQEDYKKVSTVSISANDVQQLQDKVSALINDVQGYKEAMDTACSPTKAARNSAAINLVEKRLVAMASCDAVYYRCYYAAVVSYNSGNTGDSSDVAAMIPHPPTYFSCPGLAWDVHGAGVESFRVFLGETSNNKLDDLAAPLDDSTRHVLLESWGLNGRLSSTTTCAKDAVGNPLLTLWQSRFLETIRHVWATRYSAVKSPLALREAFNSINETNGAQVLHNNGQEALLKMHETEAVSPAVAQWRDSVRDYPANFYAYAAPTTEALQAISNCLGSSGIGQILEAGAGTGYWSALLHSHLKRSGKKCEGAEKDETAPSEVPLVVPYDISPPSSTVNEEVNDRAAFSNEYHGNIPTFMDVHKANTFSQALSTSSTSANMALLLCYPPPGSDMAQRALSAHISNGGQTVLHIGEWQGLTGDATFEALLTQKFSCQEKDIIPLPLWSTDNTYLTIWKKKGSGEEEDNAQADTNSCSPALGYCSVKQCSNHARKRCRYARCLQYCSLECYGKHSSQRRAVLAMHMISSQTASGDELMKYEEDSHFLNLGNIAAFERGSSESSERPRKKSKKKRR